MDYPITKARALTEAKSLLVDDVLNTEYARGIFEFLAGFFRNPGEFTPDAAKRLADEAGYHGDLYKLHPIGNGLERTPQYWFNKLQEAWDRYMAADDGPDEHDRHVEYLRVAHESAMMRLRLSPEEAQARGW